MVGEWGGACDLYFKLHLVTCLRKGILQILSDHRCIAGIQCGHRTGRVPVIIAYHHMVASIIIGQLHIGNGITAAIGISNRHIILVPGIPQSFTRSGDFKRSGLAHLHMLGGGFGDDQWLATHH